MRPFQILLFLPLLFLSCNKQKDGEDDCNGDTRREIKLLTDALTASIDTTAESITLAALGELTVPEVKSETGRQTVEMQVYTVRATVDKVKVEHDGDYHIRLKDGDNYLITECPNPNCTYALSSPYAGIYRQVREFIDANDLEGKEVSITGVAFVDIDHHYARKEAKNRMELHPILRISF